MSIELQHLRVRLALHCLREAPGPTLLLLHALGEQSPDAVPVECAAWTGSVYALDFSGHGASMMPRGGGYTCEALMGDADAALAHLGPVTVFARGLGAYIAVLLAGARPELVRGVVLCDGQGLAGGGTSFDSVLHARRALALCANVDPRALIELEIDPRPAQYANAFAQQAAENSGLARPFSVCCEQRPEWLAMIVAGLGLKTASVAESLAYYAREARS